MLPGGTARAALGENTVFENLSEKFQHVFKTLRGEAKLTEQNMAEALREIRLALLEADVELQVVKQLLENVRTKCQGHEVWSSFSPAQQVVKIVRDELVELLGGTTSKLKFSNTVFAPSAARAVPV